MLRSALIIILAGELIACTADIRPEPYGLDQPIAEDAKRGRALVERAKAAVGGDAWLAHRTASIDMRDTWQGLVGWLGNPWPEMQVNVRMDLALGGADARAEFLDGDDAGLVWGLEAQQTYESAPGGPPMAVENSDAEFILSALHYLIELPVRATEMPLLTALPDEVVRGRRYHRVLGSWETLSPHAEHDQYLLYIDAEDGRIAKAEFTIRAIAGFARGAIHYEDVRDVAGMRVPYRMTLSSAATDDPSEGWLHVVEVERYRFDVIERAALTPLSRPGA